MTRSSQFACASTLIQMSLSLLAACASPPLVERERQTAAATPDCTALDAQIAQAGDAQRAAAQKQHDAWKLVVPIAAAARYGQGVVEATQSAQRLSELQAQADRQGCRGPGIATDAARSEGLSTASRGEGLRVRSLN